MVELVCHVLVYNFHSLVHVYSTVVTGERNMAPEHCANGAAEYLFYGGILTLVLNLLSLLAGAARQCALRDGEISGMENCGLCFLGLIVGLLGITFLVVLIWVSGTLPSINSLSLTDKKYETLVQMQKKIYFQYYGSFCCFSRTSCCRGQ